MLLELWLYQGMNWSLVLNVRLVNFKNSSDIVLFLLLVFCIYSLFPGSIIGYKKGHGLKSWVSFKTSHAWNEYLTRLIQGLNEIIYECLTQGLYRFLVNISFLTLGFFYSPSSPLPRFWKVVCPSVTKNS